MTEFALCVPILLVILGLTIDFARVYFYDLALRDAAFAAARYAGMNPFDDSGIKNAAVNAAPGGVLSAANVTINAPLAIGCDGTRQTGCPLQISVSYVFSPITPVVTTFTGASVTLSRNQTDIVK